MNWKEINIAFCADRNILVGLHVTIRSMLEHVDQNCIVHIHIVSDDLSDGDIEDLQRSCIDLNKRIVVQLYNVSTQSFRDLKSLQGWMAYSRLLLPQILSIHRVLYLDSDLVVKTDVAPLYFTDLGEFAIGAVSRQKIHETNDRIFFEMNNFDTNSPYFNSGVLLMNLDAWRKNKLTERCLACGTRFNKNLPTVDQTILNYIFNNNFYHLPTRFNLPVNPAQKPVSPNDIENKIAHLIGFPKPWDLGGMLFNQQSHLYRDVVSRTIYSDYSSVRTITGTSLIRSIRKIKNYFKNGLAVLKYRMTK